MVGNIGEEFVWPIGDFETSNIFSAKMVHDLLFLISKVLPNLISSNFFHSIFFIMVHSLYLTTGLHRNLHMLIIGAQWLLMLVSHLIIAK